MKKLLSAVALLTVFAASATLYAQPAAAKPAADAKKDEKKDPEVAKKLLTLLKDKEQVRPQDIVMWYAYLLRNKHSRNLTWQWLIENWIWLTETFASSKSYDYFPRYAASFMNSEEWLGEYKKFFMPKINDPALTRAIKIGVSEIEARVQWRKRDEKPIADWFASRSLQ